MMKTCRLGAAIATSAFVAACGGGSPTAPTTPACSVRLVFEPATMRYYHEGGDTIDITRQEAFNAWAIERLGIVLPQKVEYRKYPSRDAMGRCTGNGNTNGFAEPSLWRFHTIWPFDNHEVVHLYTAVVGRPSDFFDEGIAVSFQTDPGRGDFTVRFGHPSSSPGQQVHDACREYLRNGSLPLPVSRYVTTSGFRGISDQLVGYHTAGSFVLHMTERFGLPPVLRFFQTSNREDTLDVIRGRIQDVVGVSLDEIENSWLAMLRAG